MEEAFEVCDRVGILSRGRLAAIGKPARLVEDFGGSSSVTVRLSEVSRPLATALQAKFVGVEFVGKSEFRMQAEDPQAVIDTVMAMSRDHGVALQEAVVREPSLESAYLNLTRVKL
jgi:ABC-2 type transport system ATP-binding protein